MSVNSDGTIYACGNFVGCGIEKNENNNVIIGTVQNGISQNLIRQFLESLQTIDMENCKQCQFYTRCYTTCPYINFMASGDIYTIADKHCEINKVMVITADTIIDTLTHTNNSLLTRRFLKRMV